MHTPNHTCDVDALNKLLRGELSAVETYDQAIAKFENKAAAADLRGIREEHQRAAAAIRDQVTKFGGVPSKDSGAWGSFATAVTGAAKAMGPDTVLAALKKGEEHGISEYEEAIANKDVNPECKDLFRTDLLPKCRTHISELERLSASA
jgi:bacterioferritin (cytochrome b1)